MDAILFKHCFLFQLKQRTLMLQYSMLFYDTAGDIFLVYINKRQWLFRHRQQFALGIYFAVIIHMCLYSRICYNYTSDTVV